MSCKCQACGVQYKVDLVVPDQVWERIKPSGKAKDAGLLCGRCIMDRIEDFGEYGALLAVEPKADKISVQVKAQIAAIIKRHRAEWGGIKAGHDEKLFEELQCLLSG